MFNCVVRLWLLVMCASLIGCPSSKRNDVAATSGPHGENSAMHTSDAARASSTDVAPAPSGTSSTDASPTDVEPIADRLKIAGLEMDETRQLLTALQSHMARGMVASISGYWKPLKSSASTTCSPTGEA
jgi:hypothetical protein